MRKRRKNRQPKTTRGDKVEYEVGAQAALDAPRSCAAVLPLLPAPGKDEATTSYYPARSSTVAIAVISELPSASHRATNCSPPLNLY